MKKIINKFLLKHDDLYDLADWRDWFSNTISLIFVILFPFSFIYLFPDYIARGLYFLILIDILLWIYLLLRAFVPGIVYYFRNFIWVIILYAATISFFLNLGPDYARPAWMILCTVVSAIFYGVRGAMISSLLNPVILIVLYFLTDSTDTEWLQVHNDGFIKWLHFVSNFTLLSICTSVSVGFMINRLNRSLHIERNVKEELQASNEELTAAIEELEAVNEEFETQNNELLISANALRESELEMKEIFNSSHDAFIVHDINGTIFDINNRMLDMYRLTREEALHLNIADISSPGTDIKYTKEDLHRISEGKTLLFEWKARRPGDNSIFDVEVALRKLNWRGAEAILASVRDITDRKNIEAENQRIQSHLVQAQKMEAVGTLAGGIAHDFNNVLGGIIGSLSLLDVLLKNESLRECDEINDYLSIAEDSAHRAADITKQLLVLSRKREPQKIPVQIMNSISSVMNICKSSFPKLVELDFHPVDPSLQVYADPTQMEQMLLNLCMNASHAMTIMRGQNGQQGGRLTVETGSFICSDEFHALHPGSLPGSSYVQIRVEDTGVGMDEECRKRIFEPFFTTKSQDEGTGLGLAITYTIIIQHKGFIDVFSTPGKGSVFTVYLPQIDETSILPADDSSEIISGSGRILLVDDEENMLLVARGILKLCGYTVTTAAGALQGIKLFRESNGEFDGVVLDDSMPGMSGLDVYLTMRDINPGIRVMLCSGLPDDKNIDRLREKGIREFISKPYNIGEFSIRMHNMLNN